MCEKMSVCVLMCVVFSVCVSTMHYFLFVSLSSKNTWVFFSLLSQKKIISLLTPRERRMVTPSHIETHAHTQHVVFTMYTQLRPSKTLACEPRFAVGFVASGKAGQRRPDVKDIAVGAGAGGVRGKHKLHRTGGSKPRRLPGGRRFGHTPWGFGLWRLRFGGLSNRRFLWRFRNWRFPLGRRFGGRLSRRLGRREWARLWRFRGDSRARFGGLCCGSWGFGARRLCCCAGGFTGSACARRFGRWRLGHCRRASSLLQSPLSLGLTTSGDIRVVSPEVIEVKVLFFLHFAGCGRC